MLRLCRITVFLCSLISLDIVGFTKEHKNNSINISIINLPVNTKANIEIDTIDMLRGSFPIFKLDSNRKNIEFNLAKPKFVMLKIKEQSFELYLEPTFNLQITVDSVHESLQFKGKGAEINNYFHQSNSVKEIFLLKNYKSNSGHKMKDLKEKLDSFKIIHENFYKKYVDSVKLSKDMMALMQRQNAMLYSSLEVMFLWSYCRDKQSQVPDSIMSSLIIPQDTVLFNYGSEQYANTLQIGFYLKYLKPKRQNKSNNESQTKRESMPFLVKKAIENDNHPLYLKEICLAKNVLNYIEVFGNSLIVDSLWFDFKKNYPNSIWTVPLEKQYNELLTLASGKPAPEISGQTSNGAEFSLSQLKGNIVYVDVWATWCGPCVAQFPYSRKLENKFKDNDKVRFLFVSIDDNKAKWQKKIKENMGENVIHILIDKENHESLFKRYKFQGVPQFILIDQNGLVVNAKADWPYTGKVEGEIEKLLLKVE